LSLLSKLSVLRFGPFSGYALKRLPALLSSIPSDNELSEVTITVIFDDEFEDPQRNWAALDNILAQSRFNYMKLLQLEVTVSVYDVNSTPDDAHIRAVMPIADSRRILEIQLDVVWISSSEGDEYMGHGPFE
jgi:hypothetical protein